VNAPGWYPDPGDEHDLRFHNGTQWTGDVSTNGERFVAPLPPSCPPVSRRTGTLALSAGVVALAISWIPFVGVVGIVLAIVAIVAGVRGRRFDETRGPSTAGLATGTVAVLFGIGGLALSVVIAQAVERFQNPGEYDVAIDSCDEADDVTRATGSITNRSDDTQTYIVTVDFVDDDDDRGEADGVTLDDVEPGATAPFVADLDFRYAELDCVVASVTGPRPFGLDLDE